MKNKDIKKKIKQAAIQEIPDVLQNINLETIQIEDKPMKKKTHMNLPYKFIFASLMFLLAFILSFNLFFNQETQSPFETNDELLAFQTVSAESLLSYSLNEDTTLSMPLSETTSTSADDLETYLDDMKPMINLAELIVNQKDDISYQVMDSDRQEYSNQIVFMAENLSEEIIEFNIYYNQHDDYIQGIVVSNDTTYEFRQDHESYRLSIDDERYIEVNNQKDNGEHQFTFRYVKNQQEIYTTMIDVLLENNEYQADFTYINQRGIQIALSMRRKNGDGFDVDYQVNDQQQVFKGRFNVQVENDQATGRPMYHFMFDDESEAQSERPGHQPNHPGRGPRF